MEAPPSTFPSDEAAAAACVAALLPAGVMVRCALLPSERQKRTGAADRALRLHELRCPACAPNSALRVCVQLGRLLHTRRVVFWR